MAINFVKSPMLTTFVAAAHCCSRCEEWTCDRLREGLDSFTELPNHQCDNRFTTATTYTTEKKGHQTSAESWVTGRAVACIPRVCGGGTHRSGHGAFGNMCQGGHV
jgi:hypothetical protein